MGEDLPGPGAHFGAYVLTRELGRGGMAVVFEGEHQRLGKRVAIKILQPHAASNAVLRARFEREGRAAVRVQHPNVAEVLDCGSEDGQPYIVMELVRGPTLAELIAREAPMSPPRAMELFLPVISALSRAHAARVVHRDLKPANILIATELHGNPCPKIVDFGISKILDGEDASITREHGVVGSLAYMAPEQLRSAANADARSDQWAVGVALYECLTGVLPFRGESSLELMRELLEASPSPPSAHRAELRKDLDAVILRTLRSDPRARHPDMKSLGASLLRFANASTYALWAREFETVSADPTVTADDSFEEVEHTPLPGSNTVESAPKRLQRPAVIALAAIAIVGTLLFVRNLRTSASVQPQAPAIAPPAPVAPAASTVSPPPSATASAVPPAPSALASASASASVSALLSASASASIAHPAPRPKAAAAPPPSISAALVAPAPSTPPPTPPTNVPKASTGTLGSPILE